MYGMRKWITGEMRAVDSTRPLVPAFLPRSISPRRMPGTFSGSQEELLTRVQQQCLLAATAQNIKKIALLLGRNGSKMRVPALQTLLSTYIDQLRLYGKLLDPASSLN